MVNPQVTKEKVGGIRTGAGTGTGTGTGGGTCSLDPTDGKPECKRCSNHPPPPPKNKGKCSTGSGNSSRKNSGGGCEDGKCTIPGQPPANTTAAAPTTAGGGNSKPGKWKKKEVEDDECAVEKPQAQKMKMKEKAFGEGKGNGNKKTQTMNANINKNKNEPTCATHDEGGFIPINQPFIFAMNPVTLKYKAILLDAQQLDSVSKARFNTAPSEAGTSAPVSSKKSRTLSRAFIPPSAEPQTAQNAKSVVSEPQKCIAIQPVTKSVGMTTSTATAAPTTVPTNYTATYNPPSSQLTDNQNPNSTKRFNQNNMYDSSAPALILPSSKNVANSGAGTGITFNSIKRSSLPSKTSGRNKDPSEITDPLEAAFYQFTLSYHPLLWVFGYSHDQEIADHRRRCLESLAERNNLYIIDLDREIRRFEDATVRRTSASIAQSISGSRTASGTIPVSVKDLNDLIVVRAKQLVRKVTIEKRPLSTEEICQLIKYVMLSVIHDDGSGSRSVIGSGTGQGQGQGQGQTHSHNHGHGHTQGYHNIARNSGQVIGSETKGFIVDGFPQSASEGVDAENFLYKTTVCLYFEGREWSGNKTVEPKIIKPKYHLRSAPYSEKEVEGAADFFGFKTIKVLNTEDLRDVQIEDIATLVHTHLEGRGLALHKIITKDPKNPGNPGAIKNQGTNTNANLNVNKGSGYGSGPAIGEVSTNYVLDHQNFLNAANSDPNRTVGKKTAILQTAGIKGPPPPPPPKGKERKNDKVVEPVNLNLNPAVTSGQEKPTEDSQVHEDQTKATQGTKSGVTTTTAYTSATGSGSGSASGYFTETATATAAPSGNKPPQSTAAKSNKSSKA